MKIAFVGCGYVADFYMRTLANHANLTLAGIHDRDTARMDTFAAHHTFAGRRHDSLQTLLADPDVTLVVNLTNPREHSAINRACLEHGKHVYCEKPLALDYEDAKALVGLAERRGLLLASAPCNVLGETAQTIWKALRTGVIGIPRLAYAELDDGAVHQRNYRIWRSESGAFWPWKDEFEVGCTFEHAGYYLTWLVTFFGPAVSVSGDSATLVVDKNTSEPLNVTAPDFASVCVRFRSGTIARLTISIVAPHNHALTIVGTEGVIGTAECWDYGSPVYVAKRQSELRAAYYLAKREEVPLVRPAAFRHRYERASHTMDFCRGIAECAEAVETGRPCRLSSRLCLHVLELTWAIHHIGETNGRYGLESTFEPTDPMPWARDD